MVVMVMMMMVVVLLSFKLLPHIIRILTIRIVFRLHIMNLLAQRLRIQIELRPITLPHM